MRIGMTAPASTYFYQLTADSLTEQFRTSTNGALTSVAGFTPGQHINFKGFFLCSGTGSFTVGFASTGGAQATIAQGSFIVVQKMA